MTPKATTFTSTLQTAQSIASAVSALSPQVIPPAPTPVEQKSSLFDKPTKAEVKPVEQKSSPTIPVAPPEPKPTIPQVVSPEQKAVEPPVQKPPFESVSSTPVSFSFTPKAPETAQKSPFESTPSTTAAASTPVSFSFTPKSPPQQASSSTAAPVAFSFAPKPQETKSIFGSTPFNTAAPVSFSFAPKAPQTAAQDDGMEEAASSFSFGGLVCILYSIILMHSFSEPVSEALQRTNFRWIRSA